LKKPLSPALKTFYGFGDMGFSLMASVETFFFVYFLTNVAKFSLPMVAIIGTITSVADAALSPFYGGIIDGTKPMKWGRVRSWILICPPIVVPFYIFQYSRIGPNEAVAAAIVCAGFIISHIFWNLPWVANLSLISVLANNPEERALLSSRRATWTMLAGMIFSFIGSPLALKIGELTGNEALGYQALAGIMGLVFLIGYWTIFKLTDGYEETGEQAQASAAKANKVSVGDMLKSALQNPPLIVLLIGDFFRYMVNFIMSSAAAYYFTYVAKNMALLPIYMFVGSLGGVIGAYFAGILCNKYSTRTVSIWGLFGMALSLIGCKFVAFSIIPFFVLILVARSILGVLSASVVALYSDAAVYSEWKTGKSAAAFVMGLMTISLKAAVISRGTVIPFVLATAGFVATADPATASLELQNAVVNVFVFIPGILALISAFIIGFGYRLTRERLAELQAEIDARKAAAQ
jgi:GPH family glycoside/pentoside/hexuronide:cation symporter